MKEFKKLTAYDESLPPSVATDHTVETRTAEECYKQCGNTKSSGGDNPICLNCGSSIKDKRREIIKRKFEGLSVRETNLIIECMDEYANQFKK